MRPCNRPIFLMFHVQFKKQILIYISLAKLLERLKTSSGILTSWNIIMKVLLLFKALDQNALQLRNVCKENKDLKVQT
jgi:hypothetical protein